MRTLKIFACLAGMAMLAACSTIQAVAPPDLKTSLTQLGAFTLADLKNADAIATAQTPPDVIGHQCFAGLASFVQSQQAPAASPQTVSGAFSALEAGRTAVSNAGTLISKSQIQSLELACGPLVIDTQNQAALFIAGLAALGAK